MIGPSAPLALTMHLAWVSSISFGGFPTVLPDVRNFVVSARGAEPPIIGPSRFRCRRREC